ncbi:hypothetical protein [Amphibacillus cookii]|nr:hypothetical protein [Amphibacillus cookii]MBM7541176.1 uncharacterized membrane protein (UPF0136 family) [Amphibacillus cookii]
MSKTKTKIALSMLVLFMGCISYLFTKRALFLIIGVTMSGLLLSKHT